VRTHPGLWRCIIVQRFLLALRDTPATERVREGQYKRDQPKRTACRYPDPTRDIYRGGLWMAPFTRKLTRQLAQRDDCEYSGNDEKAQYNESDRVRDVGAGLHWHTPQIWIRDFSKHRQKPPKRLDKTNCQPRERPVSRRKKRANGEVSALSTKRPCVPAG
jgi:hypothetical protein